MILTDGFLWLQDKKWYFRFTCRTCTSCSWRGVCTYTPSEKCIMIRSTSHDCHTDFARRMPLCPWSVCWNSESVLLLLNFLGGLFGKDKWSPSTCRFFEFLVQSCPFGRRSLFFLIGGVEKT